LNPELVHLIALEINKRIDIPLINEEQEQWIFELVIELIVGLITKGIIKAVPK
jgi:hypothetical protein